MFCVYNGQIGGAGLAVWDKPECGPLFGSDGFGVSMQKNSPKIARCKLGRCVSPEQAEMSNSKAVTAWHH